MILFDAPNVYIDGEFVHENRVIYERPNMKQVSSTFIPDHNLYGKNLEAVRGDIFCVIFCNDGLVIFSILPDSLYDKTRD